MSDENEEILDELACPICFEYPEKEVFQCKNGHPICSICIQKLENCPLCELPFGVPLIRCRLMESLLNKVRLHCANKDSGCAHRFLRKDLPDHHKICDFRSVNLCKWMGYECNFTASTVAPLIQHLETCHNAMKKPRGQNIVWEDYNPDSPTLLTIFLQECVPNSDSQLPLQDNLSYLLPADECAEHLRGSEKPWILLLYKLSVGLNNQTFLSFVPIHLHDGQCTGDHRVRLEVFNRQNNRLLANWTGIPPNYKDAEEDFLIPSFRLTSNYIMKQGLKFSKLAQFDLALRFTVEVTPIPSWNE